MNLCNISFVSYRGICQQVVSDHSKCGHTQGCFPSIIQIFILDNKGKEACVEK